MILVSATDKRVSVAKPKDVPQTIAVLPKNTVILLAYIFLILRCIRSVVDEFIHTH